MKTYVGFVLIFCVSIVIVFESCNKNISNAEINLAYNMLADKTWYLQEKQTISGSSVVQNNYVGQATYFINFLKTLTTFDSDGLSGSYVAKYDNNQLQLFFTVKSSTGVVSNYSYSVASLGEKKMVLFSVNGSLTTKYYYSTEK